MTYSVGLGDIKASKNVIEQLQKAYEDNEILDGNKAEYADALDWIQANFKERDCFEWECEIKTLNK